MNANKNKKASVPVAFTREGRFLVAKWAPF